MENRKGFTERICKMAAVGLTAAVLPAAVFSGEAGTVRAEGTTETVYAAAYVGAESTEETTLPDTVKVDGSDCTVAWDMDSAAFDTAYDTVTVNGMAEGGTEVSAQVEVIPENLVYFISGGTGTGYVNKNTKAAVSEPFNAISGLADLKNDTSDALYSEESGWGHLSDSTYLISATVENGDRPDDYTSVNKYTVGLRDKSSGAAPMTYRFTLEAGKYEMTVGYHEFYGANRSRDMQPSVTWTDFGGSEQTVEGDLIQLRSADQTGVISFELDSTCVVEFQLEKVSGEAPMYSWIGISRTGDAEMEAGYTVTYLAKILEEQEQEIEAKEEEGYIYTESTKTEYDQARENAQYLVDEGSTDADAIRAALEMLTETFDNLKVTKIYSSFTGSKGSGSQEWLDNNGEHIQAHGGQVQWLDSLDLDGDGAAEGGWIWYGEDKTRDGKPIDGVRCYTSPDLYNWTDRGTVLSVHEMIPAKLTDDGSGIEDDLDALETLKEWAKMSEPAEDVTQEDIDMAKEFVEAYRNADGTYDEENLELAFRNLYSGYCIVERPKMLYNESTDQYVLIFHSDGPSDANIAKWLQDPSSSPSRYTRASMGFAVSDTPYGPFKLVNVQRMNYVEGYYDSSQGMARDMNVFIDDTDIDQNGVKDAYAIYSSEENRKMYISLLNADYTGPATEGTADTMTLDDGTQIQTFAARVLPADSREAPALFKYDGYYYMITSGTSGWSPNQALYYRSETIYGPYEAMGDPCIGDNGTTFYSQSTAVIPVDAENGKFIYMGDRWLTTDTTGSAAWYSSYVWLPIQIGEDHTISLSAYEDWSMEELSAAQTVSAILVEGEDLSLPETVTVEYFTGGSEERAVTWNLENVDFGENLFRTVNVTGTVKELGITANAEVLVLPDDPEYVIDCANPDSEMFALVSELAGENLRQDTADQSKTEENEWGYVSEIGTDITEKTTSETGIYDTGWYALDGKNITYQVTLEAGTYEIALGFNDWWGQYDTRPMTVYYQIGEGDEEILCDVPAPKQELTQASGMITLEEESVVTLTVKKAGDKDPILNWITVVDQNQTEEDPGTEEPDPEEPGTEEPDPEEPGTEEPGTEEPGTEEPGTEEPGTEEPGTEEPGTEEPGTEEPGTEEPGTEEPGTDEPGADEPGTGEPGTEEPEGQDPDDGKDTGDGAGQDKGGQTTADQNAGGNADNSSDSNTVKAAKTGDGTAVPAAAAALSLSVTAIAGAGFLKRRRG